MINFKNHITRHAIATAIAITLAILTERQFAQSQEGWIVISTLLVSQTTRGTPFKQSLYYFILIVSGIISAALLTYILPSVFLLQVVAAAIFAGAGITVFYHRPLQDTSYFTIILFPLVLLLAAMLPAANLDLLSARLIDVLIGAVIAVACGQIIFPVRPYQDMVMGLTAVLKAFINYSNELADFFSSETGELKAKRADIEASLQAAGGVYPEWVYEAGFNPGLRAGYRYFLVNIERVSEIFFSIDLLVAANVMKDMPLSLRRHAAEAVRINSGLLLALQQKLHGEVVDHAEIDFVNDIDALEREAAIQLPGGLDLLGFTDEYAQVTMLARDLKDMRQLLLQLLLSVPMNQSRAC